MCPLVMQPRLPPLLLLLLLAATARSAASETFLHFGDGFVFGVVQDAYQFEGSLTAGGAGASSLHTWCASNLAKPNMAGGSCAATWAQAFTRTCARTSR